MDCAAEARIATDMAIDYSSRKGAPDERVETPAPRLPASAPELEPGAPVLAQVDTRGAEIKVPAPPKMITVIAPEAAMLKAAPEAEQSGGE